MTLKDICESVAVSLSKPDHPITADQISSLSDDTGDVSEILSLYHAIQHPGPRVYIDGVFQEPGTYVMVNSKPVFPFAIDAGSIVTYEPEGKCD